MKSDSTQRGTVLVCDDSLQMRIMVIDALEEGRLELRPPEKPTEAAAPRMPLLQWRRAGVE
jgi:hypothetical protein